MPPKSKKAANVATPTTAQALGSLLKSARDIMRKDKGLNGDLDRLPLLTWIMFLKFLDDLESQGEAEATLAGKKFRPAIEAPYRWRDWAANPQGVTGDEVLAFINHDDAVRPDGGKGPGLFAYLRQLTSANGDDRRDVIATVFRGVDNRMKSGYLLRDVINKVASIHFTSSEELHTLGALYESMLREMRDAAGDSGEFYTPRAVVRFMVEAIDPQLGETILDPAAGTGGFLVETFRHLSKQVKTVAHRKFLQEESIYGCEPKSLPYLLCQMNLLLHGLDAPHIDPANALRFKLSEIGEKERVDVIVTNPPFGGAEEKGIQGNFPEDRQTDETALLFLQLIMRRLRRTAKQSKRSARAAVIVPDATLFGTGVCARIKEELLSQFNLHTVVRLPEGVFAPYAKTIKTNIIFFDREPPNEYVWFYEVPPPQGRTTYTKTNPIQYESFSKCIEWWNSREESDFAWRVQRKHFVDNGYNLIVKNPRSTEALTYSDPKTISVMLTDLHRKIGAELERLNTTMAIGVKNGDLANAPSKLGDAIQHRKEAILIDDLTEYKRPRVQLHVQGIVLRDSIEGALIKTKKQQVCRAGDLLVAEIDAKVGGFGIVPPELDGSIVSSHYYLYTINTEKLDRRYLGYFIRTTMFRSQVAAQGSTNYAAIRPSDVLGYKIPIPPLTDQRKIVAVIEELERVRALQGRSMEMSEGLLQAVLHRAFDKGF